MKITWEKRDTNYVYLYFDGHYRFSCLGQLGPSSLNDLFKEVYATKMELLLANTTNVLQVLKK